MGSEMCIRDSSICDGAVGVRFDGLLIVLTVYLVPGSGVDLLVTGAFAALLFQHGRLAVLEVNVVFDRDVFFYGVSECQHIA